MLLHGAMRFNGAGNGFGDGRRGLDSCLRALWKFGHILSNRPSTGSGLAVKGLGADGGLDSRLRGNDVWG